MIIDLIIIAFIIAFIALGTFRGFIGSLVSVFSVIIALIVALVVYKPVGNLVYTNTTIGENIKQTIVKNIPLNDSDLTIPEDAGLPDFVIKNINEKITSLNESKDKAVNDVAEEISKNIINIGCFVLIFLVVRGILLLIKILTKLIDKLPIIGKLDKTGGAILRFYRRCFYSICSIRNTFNCIANDKQ